MSALEVPAASARSLTWCRPKGGSAMGASRPGVVGPGGQLGRCALRYRRLHNSARSAARGASGSIG
eukprot:705781-Pyramimonas_sp.AAC.1